MNNFFNGGLDARAYLRAGRLSAYLSFAFTTCCLTVVLSVKIRWEAVMPIARLLRDPLVVQIAYALAFTTALVFVVVLGVVLHFLYVKDLVHEVLSQSGSESASSEGNAEWQSQVFEHEVQYREIAFQVIGRAGRTYDYYKFLQRYLNVIRAQQQGKLSGKELDTLSKKLVVFDQLPSVKEGRRLGKVTW